MKDIKYKIDNISNETIISSGYMSISGWIYHSKQKIHKLNILHGNKTFGCNYKITRLDVEDFYKDKLKQFNHGFIAKLENIDLNDKFILEIHYENNKIDKIDLGIKLEHKKGIDTLIKKNDIIYKIQKKVFNLKYNNNNLLPSRTTNDLYCIGEPTEIACNNGNINIDGWFCDKDGRCGKKIVVHINGEKYTCHRKNNPVICNKLKQIGINSEDNIKFKKTIYKPKGIYFYKIEVFKQDETSVIIDKGKIHVIDIDNKKKKHKINNTEFSYKNWLSKHNIRNLDEVKTSLNDFKKKPLISIILPTYNTPSNFLTEAIESVFSQIYENWELCISDDASTDETTKDTILKYKEKDNRVKTYFSEKNGHISKSSNHAISLASGDFIALLDHDDVLDPYALFEVVKVINQTDDVDYIYTDEDKITESGDRDYPFFKPGWSPDFFLTCMYTCHFSVIRKSIIDDLKGFREGYQGAQDYDLILRVTEKARIIVHIPHILYSWRIHSLSTASDENETKTYAYTAAEKAIEDALKRRGHNATRLPAKIKGHHRIKYEIKNNPLVSIVIPTASSVFDKYNDILFIEKLLKNIHITNTYKNIEIIIIDNDDLDHKRLMNLGFNDNQIKFSTFHYNKKDEKSFNLSKKLNQGVKLAKGDYLVILNDDITFINNSWIESMLGFCQLDHVGVVGAKLLFPNSNIQHAGVVLPQSLPFHVFYNYSGSDDGYSYNLKSVCNYSAVTGACIMTKSKLFNKLNGWNEKLPLCYNDIDYCLRIKKLGYYIVYNPEILATHYESASREGGGIPLELSYFRELWLDEYQTDEFYNKNLSIDGLYKINNNI